MTYCLPFQAPQKSHLTPGTRRSGPTLSATSSSGTRSSSAISCMARGDSTLMSAGGRRAARSVIHPKKQIRKLAKNIQLFGFTNPLLVDEKSVLLAGHGRLAAAKSIGLATVPVLRICGLSEA